MLCLVFAFGLIIMCNPLITNAATKNVTCVSESKRKKAPKLKAGKTYTIKNKGRGLGYIMFKAPKTKVYTFSFSNYKSIGVSKDKDDCLVGVVPMDEACFKEISKGNISFLGWDSIKYDNVEKDDRDFDLYFASKKCSEEDYQYWHNKAFDEDFGNIDGDELNSDALVEEYVNSRYVRTNNVGKIKLKKGKVIYLKFYQDGDSDVFKKGFTCKLKIK